MGHALGSHLEYQTLDTHDNDTLAERSKAVAQGAIPKGRGFEPHRCHFEIDYFCPHASADPDLQNDTCGCRDVGLQSPRRKCLSALMFSWASLRITSIFQLAGQHRIAQ